MMSPLRRLFDRRPTTAEGWLARMSRSDVDARDQAGLLAWLESDPDHLADYEIAKADYAALSELRGALAVDLARLNGHRWPARRDRRWVLAGGGVMAAAAVAAVLVPTLMASSPYAGAIDYVSAPGQIRDIALADGTTITLDADSAVRVALHDDARRVVLERGAAYFDVAHDAAVPFQVAVADRRVIVTGTRFTTRLRGEKAEVSLLEGRVAIGAGDVRSRGALDRAQVLQPGDRARFTPFSVGLHVAKTDVELETAWRQRRLVFHDATLAEVVAEAGRYADRPLVIADPRLARMRVTAVLPLEGQGALVDRMAALLPIRVETGPDGQALIRAE
jgi:transmembrane sensor